MKRYRLLVCKGPDCRDNGSDALFEKAQATVAANGLGVRCAVDRGGCFGLCHLGANVVVREQTAKRDPFSSDDFQLTGAPDETYYWRMDGTKLERVILEHVGGQRPVSELKGDPLEPEVP